MLDVLQAVVFSLAVAIGVMRLVDLVDKPSGQRKSRARSGARARHKVLRSPQEHLQYTTCAHLAQGEIAWKAK